jgi:hypothetical protein
LRSTAQDIVSRSATQAVRACPRCEQIVAGPSEERFLPPSPVSASHNVGALAPTEVVEMMPASNEVVAGGPPNRVMTIARRSSLDRRLRRSSLALVPRK